MKFRCDHCGADSPLDRGSLVLRDDDEVPHIKCKMCGKMSLFGGGQVFSGERPPPRPEPAPAAVPVVNAPPAPIAPIAPIVMWGIVLAAVAVAVGAMVVASRAASQVSEMKWNKADVSALGDQEAEHERHDHHQALVVLGSPDIAQVGVLPVFLSAPAATRGGDGFWVDGFIHNALSMGMSKVEIQFVDASGKEKIGVAKVGVVEAGKSVPWRVFLPGLKDERFVSVYAIVEHQLQL